MMMWSTHSVEWDEYLNWTTDKLCISQSNSMGEKHNAIDVIRERKRKRVCQFIWSEWCRGGGEVLTDWSQIVKLPLAFSTKSTRLPSASHLDTQQWHEVWLTTSRCMQRWSVWSPENAQWIGVATNSFSSSFVQSVTCWSLESILASHSLQECSSTFAFLFVLSRSYQLIAHLRKLVSFFLFSQNHLHPDTDHALDYGNKCFSPFLFPQVIVISTKS